MKIQYKKYFISILIVVTLGIIFFSNRTKFVEDVSEKHKVTVRLRWTTQTQFAGYFVALDKGFYEDENLIVDIKEGIYGANPLKTVENEIEEFGIQWPSDLITAGNQFISLANIVKDSGFVLISKKNKGYDSFAKFENLKISTWFIGHEHQLKALIKKKGLQGKGIGIVFQKWDLSQFYNDEVEVASAMSYNELLNVYDNGYPQEKLNTFSLKEEGIGFPGQSIFTTHTFYNSNPELCKSFVQASIKGWEYAIAHPQEAVDIVMKYDIEKKLNRDHQYKQMLAMIKLIMIDKYPLGINLKEDYEFITDVYKKYGIIQKSENVDSYYTNEFITEK